MEVNRSKISGVLHQKDSAANYQLRRYFPSVTLTSLVEQFWFVDWDLTLQSPHIQQNLPDPNCHLVINANDVKILGPVSQLFQFRMENKGRIIGVKFNIAALNNFFDEPIKHLVNRELSPDLIFKTTLNKSFKELIHLSDDDHILSSLEQLLSPFCCALTPQQTTAQKILSTIKENSNIFNVEQLVSCTGISKRTIQRYCLQYIGLSPKWLIRRYRLHQAIELLDDDKTEMLDLVDLLDYSDQAHLIRDFKEIIGLTPNQYRQVKR